MKALIWAVYARLAHRILRRYGFYPVTVVHTYPRGVHQ